MPLLDYRPRALSLQPSIRHEGDVYQSHFIVLDGGDQGLSRRT